MPFVHNRTIRFADTDAAGVVYFANYLSICHEAYEEALSAAGIELKAFCDRAGLIVPISKSEAEYNRPLACGERVRISVTPSLFSENSFEIHFEIAKVGPPEKIAARIRTEHVCLDARTRKRARIPAELSGWLAKALPPRPR